jgi:ParB-like chromosome segregation protein Spo0J
MTEQWPADKVERRAVSALIPYARNARTHSDAQVAQIAASIKEWGWTMPILVDETGGIIAGHGRLLAAQKLGLAEVPVMVAVGWSEAARRAYVIADNKLALNAGWDDELLKIELAGLKEFDFDLALTGFSDDDISSLIGDVKPLDAMPQLASGDREPFQQMTFVLHDEQVQEIKAAIEIAHSMGDYDSQNENRNGNAIARICETFVTQNAQR